MFFPYYDDTVVVVEDEKLNTEEQESKKEDNSELEDSKDAKNQKNKTYTQEDLNKFLDQERQKLTKNNTKLITELKNYKDNLNMSDDHKQQLQETIERLENERLSQQELNKREQQKIAKEFEKQITTQKSETQLWREMYTKEKIERELLDAANAHKAYSATQIKNILKPQTRLVEDIKDGKPIGTWSPKVSFPDKNENGDSIILELSPDAAVKRMSEMPEHWNLFNSGANSGLGGFNNPPNITRGTKPPADSKQFLAWAKEQGIPLK